jgi:hypothetical protein
MKIIEKLFHPSGNFDDKVYLNLNDIQQGYDIGKNTFNIYKVSALVGPNGSYLSYITKLTNGTRIQLKVYFIFLLKFRVVFMMKMQKNYIYLYQVLLKKILKKQKIYVNL